MKSLQFYLLCFDALIMFFREYIKLIKFMAKIQKEDLVDDNVFLNVRITTGEEEE